MEPTKTIEISEELRDLVEARFTSYNSYRDLFNMLFEMHAHDDDDHVVSSKPFKKFFKDFQEEKVKYDEVMNQINNTIVPDEYKTSRYRFEVNFDESVVNIIENEE